jgi:hypothetical protein
MDAHRFEGMKIPDSELARDAMQIVRDTQSELLFLHSNRVYCWAALAGDHRGLKYDPELLYVAAMFHDVGLGPAYQSSRLRFEVDGANAARDFLTSRGIPERDVAKVWTAIALHTTPGVAEHMHAEAALVQAGAGMDVVGRNYEDFSERERGYVLAAFPRGPHFSHSMIDAFYDGMKHRPETTFGTFNDDFIAFKDPSFRRMDVCCTILNSPWERNCEHHP